MHACILLRSAFAGAAQAAGCWKHGITSGVRGGETVCDGAGEGSLKSIVIVWTWGVRRRAFGVAASLRSLRSKPAERSCLVWDDFAV